jgi:DNA repair exonuclease SbcCD ATPase subunit
MIIFKKVTMRNFFSVGNSPVEINLDTHKKTLVIGKNGASKSSCMLDSIVFALYGKPFRKTNKPNIVNSINKSGLLVELEFSIGSRNYKVVRGIKPGIFEIYQNGVLINQDAKTKDYQEYLEKYILKTNYKSFINVVILGSARYTPFMSMSASDRRAIIEELLDIQIFSTMNVLLKDKASKLKEDLATQNYNIDLTKEKIDLQKQNIQEHKDKTKEQIKQKLEEIDKSNIQIEKSQKDIELIQKHISVLENKIKDKTSVETKRNKLISIESKIETNLKKLKKDSEFYEINDSCPTCKQSIDQEHKEKQLTGNRIKLEEFNTGLEKLSSDVVSLEQRLLEIKNINNHIQEHQSEIVRINASIIAIQNYIKKELVQINQISETFDNFEENNERLNSLFGELSKYEVVKEELTETKRYYDFSSVLLKDGGIKTRIIKQYLPIMNKLINTYLSKLNFFVNFNINENFEEVIKSRYRDEFKYENFSEGEKLRIDLSILFSFRQIAKMKNSVNTNLLIMDEILDGSLDLEGADQFFDLIDSLDNNTNIVVISHRGDQLGDKFDRTLKFEKKKNFTRMQEMR